MVYFWFYPRYSNMIQWLARTYTWVPHIPVEYTLLNVQSEVRSQWATNTSGLQHATRDSTGFYGYLVDFSGHEATGRAQIIGTWFEF